MSQDSKYESTHQVGRHLYEALHSKEALSGTKYLECRSTQSPGPHASDLQQVLSMLPGTVDSVNTTNSAWLCELSLALWTQSGPVNPVWRCGLSLAL